MTIEEMRDSLIVVAKQAYWEGRSETINLNGFKNTTVYKHIMKYAEESNVAVHQIRKEML
jgi:hypothetical protein